ncbi:CHAT domain-containing protein [Mycena sp. CBHHK59/15]|nr:CHAT domain-containing protein [Mycena sp. CBHHK59/15]
MHLRTPLDDLQAVHQELGSQLSALAGKLEQASVRDTTRNMLADTQTEALSIEAEGLRCRHLNEDWEEAINSVRVLPGFEDFMRPKSIVALQQAALGGPIVILNVGMSSSNALLIKSAGEVQCVPLPNMTLAWGSHLVELLRALPSSTFDLHAFLSKFPRGEYCASGDRSVLEARLLGGPEALDPTNPGPNEIFRDLLKTLWTDIASPVIDALKLKKSVSPARLWWCPIGPLTFLPIHAAGIYGEHSADCVSDYVISSYTPTLTALLDPPTRTADLFRMTAVIQPDTPNNSYLPGARAELREIQNRVPDQWLTALGDTSQATVETTISNLRQSSIVHFACHGIQDLANPLDSGLELSNGRLKVSEIMRKPENSVPEQVRKSMSLAFLSACETAKGDSKQPDEAMHLAATLLFAGFRGVVGTMWTMDDRDGPTIADAFYEHLFKSCDTTSNPPVFPNLTTAAEALHLAVIKLRKAPGIPFMRWVPFVHYGL